MEESNMEGDTSLVEETDSPLIDEKLAQKELIPSETDNAEEDVDALHEENMKNVTVATVGNVDSGKSTLVGVLTKGALDDGRGKARAKVFNFSHEAGNGR